LVKRHRLTMHTVMQAAWALLLSGYRGQTDVMFGSTISGRPADLGGVEDMVGMFVNALPMRVAVPPKQPLISWLGELQEAQIRVQQYGYVSLGQIREWLALPQDQPLFESFLRFQNYPVDASLWRLDETVQIKDIEGVDWWHHPLGIAIEPGPALTLWITYQRNSFADKFVTQLSKDFQAILAAMVTDPEQNLGILTRLAHK